MEGALEKLSDYGGSKQSGMEGAGNDMNGTHALVAISRSRPVVVFEPSSKIRSTTDQTVAARPLESGNQARPDFPTAYYSNQYTRNIAHPAQD